MTRSKNPPVICITGVDEKPDRFVASFRSEFPAQPTPRCYAGFTSLPKIGVSGGLMRYSMAR